jgi:hypothetical protein
MKLEALLTFLCPYTGIPLFSGVHVNLIHVTGEDRARIQAALPRCTIYL